MIRTVAILTVLLELVSYPVSAKARKDNDFSDRPRVCFLDSGQRFDSNAMLSWVELGDLDGDGDLDLLAGNPLKVWHNDGQGHFTSRCVLMDNHGFDIGDLDGDGDLDVCLLVDYQGPYAIFLNDGKGIFTKKSQSLSKEGADIQLCDIDGDNDLDAFIYSKRIWFNNGSGTFTAPEKNAYRVVKGLNAIGDLDGDGDVDFFIKERGQGYAVHLNDSKGFFTEYWQVQDEKAGYGSVTLGDLDNDGDLDAIITNGGYGENKPTTVWMNSGKGHFNDSKQNLGETTFGKTRLGDLNGDGFLDAVIININRPNKIWINEGHGFFRDSDLNLGEAFSCDAALGDLDGDGDLDVFVTNGRKQPDVLYLNETSRPDPNILGRD